MRMQPFNTPGDALAHYGVKGMKWGVINTEFSTGKVTAEVNTKIKEWMAASNQVKPNVTKQKAAKNLEANQKKFIAKFSDASTAAPSQLPRGLTSEQKKKALKIGLYGAGIAAIVAYSVYRNPQMVATIRGQAGKAISKEAFLQNVSLSKAKSWGFAGYVRSSSHLRKEFTLPAGTVFHRLSEVAENTHKSATYATSNRNDFNRYVASYRKEIGYAVSLNHIKFSNSKPLKVPALHTVLDTLEEGMKREYALPAYRGIVPKAIDKAEVIRNYETMSGSSWSSSLSKGLINDLRKKGYGALVDEMDAGVISETPLLIFAQNLTQKSSTPLTNAAIKAAENSLIELTNRKV